MLRIDRSTDVRVDNLIFRDPGFWAIVPTYSERVDIQNVVITADRDSPNTDGIEPMWSKDVHVKNATISNGKITLDLTPGVVYLL